jgi:hemerythrin
MDQRFVPQWQPSYSVGNQLLDDQHKKLLSLCQEAVSCMAEDGPEGRSHFHRILNELAGYVNRHFQTEEGILKQCGYPLLDHHRKEHLEYESRLTDFLLSATMGEIDRDGLHHYLSQWWSEHILGSDKQYAECIQGN